jgi:superfamily I DNA and RNA helicase
LILFTFFTKSLRATIKTLVTRFYRLSSDSDPDWKRVHIRHGWGGRTAPGVYSDACARSGRVPLKLPEANRLAGRGETAFGAACADLMNSGLVEPNYDHVLIDEGQDFPDSFYKLAFQLAKGDRDKKSVIWAYDELQDIMNVKIRQPVELFGRSSEGLPLVDLDRTAAQAPPGATNDAVLSKAYRNQRDVLVAAHALGFGIYGKNIVQMLESAEHWEDVGYRVLSGPLKVGQRVEIVRPDHNSPLSVANLNGFPTVDAFDAANLQTEVNWAVDQIRSFISGGLQPEEVLVIVLDDRSARRYLARIAEQLASNSISTNNIIADPYNEPPFTIPGKVTLSTVYRAKGNEAAAVVAVGIDAVETDLRSGRNKIFTAFTRSKAWLRVSGTSPGATAIIAELRTAVKNSPRLAFVMPDLKEIDTIQRGFSKKQAAVRAAREQYIKLLRAAGLSEEEIEEEVHQSVANE